MKKFLTIGVTLLLVVFAGSQVLAFSAPTPPVGVITLTSPDGGENWKAGSTQPITWSASGVTDVGIEYSSNGGLTWNSVSASVAANLGIFQWPIPNTLSTSQAKIRVYDLSGNPVADTSASVFTVSRIEVTAPVAGERWQTGRIKQIQWVTGGNIANIKLQFSTNGGATWGTIADTVSAAAGNYNWTVPSNASAANALIRISDVAAPAMGDTSDSFIIPSLNIIIPNGGDTWNAGSTKVIRWSAANIGTIKIEYSTTNGVTWNTITSSAIAGRNSYVWVVPNTPSAEARIRLSDSVSSSVFDISDDPFYINLLELTSFNARAGYKVGSNQSITWNTNLSTNLKIEISTNDGTSWSTLAASTSAAAGSFPFSVPNTPTNQAKIRLTSLADATLTDASDSAFTIGSVTVTAPSGGEVWQAGSVNAITWTATTGINLVKLEYTTDNGASFTTIAPGVSAAPASFSWSIPANLTAASVMVRVSDAVTGTGISALSNSFAVSRLVLTAPNGAEEFQSGRRTTITWQQNFISNIKIQYSVNNGASWNSIAGNVPASDLSYSWLIPDSLSSSQALIRISSVTDTLVRDASDNVFSISRIKVVIPADGSVLQAGTNANITWSASSHIAAVRLDYSTDNGASWNLITASTAASPAVYAWQVPQNISTQSGKIRMSIAGNPLIADTMAGVFSVKWITVTAPNGGENLPSGRPYTITWGNSSNVANVRIDYTAQNDTNFTLITASTPATGSYTWQVPAALFGANFKVRISDALTTSVKDASDSIFSISSIRVTSPAAAAVLLAGDSTNITWTASSHVTAVKLDYSLDSGSTWNAIVASTPAAPGSFTWRLPRNISSQSARVRVSVAGNPLVADTMAGTFVIKWITLTSPNGGENFQSGKSYPIAWTNSSNVANVRIDYTAQNDTNFTLIAASVPANASYTWQVPGTLSGVNFKIRVSDAAATQAIKDLSDSVFYISRLSMVSPEAGANWRSGSVQTIRWVAAGNLQTLKLEYSTNNGLIWDTVRSSIPSTDSAFIWTLPLNISTTDAKLRISSNRFPAITDTTAKFNIFIPSVVISSPNGGEFIKAGTTKNITWSAAYISSVKIEFSTNDGRIWNTITNTTPAAAGSFAWNVSSTLISDSARIKITDVSDPSIVDSSDGVFKIALVTVTSPNGGENFLAGSTKSITWTTTANVQLVNLDYKVDTVWVPIAANINAALRSFSWQVPQVASTSARIRVSDAASGMAINDTSDNTFIISVISVLTPNGGEFWQSGTLNTVRWTASSNIGNLKIEASLNNGATWSSVVDFTPAAPGQFSWNIPGSFAGDSALIRISDAANNSITDVSNAVFRIGMLSLSTPNGGEKLLVGSKYIINWTRSANTQFVDLHYSTDNGAVWVPIAGAQSYPADSIHFDWVVPDAPSDSVLVRIQNSVNVSLFDVSNTRSSIVKLQLTTPNGGQVYQAGSAQQITWLSRFVSRVAIEYTTNNGADWAIITASYPADSGKFSWSIPDDLSTASPAYKIRIRDFNASNVADTSTAVFTVSFLRLESPLGGGGQLIGTSHNIRWVASTNTISNVKLEFTTNDGISWNTIAASVRADSGSYHWIMPTTPAPSCRVRVSDVANGTIKDISDSTFTLSFITLSFPNGPASQKLQVGKVYSLSWSSGFVSNVKVEYSINRGRDWNTAANGASVPGALGKFDWTVVNAPSDQCLIRVSDAANPAIYDVSDTVFAISDIRVVSPNTIIAAKALSTYRIEWASRFIDTVSIWLSIDNGVSWGVPVATVPAVAGAYNWTVPDIRTINARVRVTDYRDYNVVDLNDTTFVIGEYPRFVSAKKYQRDTIQLLLTVNAPGEVLTLTRIEYQSGTSGMTDVTPFLVGDYSAVIGPTVAAVNLNTSSVLDNFEGLLSFRMTLRSSFNITYTIQSDSIGVDNKAPVFNIASLRTAQLPYSLGWSKTRLAWSAAADTNKPVKYSVYVTDSLNFPVLPALVTNADTAVIGDRRTATNYKLRLRVADALSNSSDYEITFKTPAAADYNADNSIDVFDLAAFVQAWNKPDSLSGADFAPYIDSVPRISVRGDSKLGVEDLVAFVRMWNYYQVNRSLPKQAVLTPGTYERRQLRLAAGDQPFAFDLNASGEGLVAVSADIFFNPASFRFSKPSVTGSDNPFTLTAVDSVNGVLRVCFAGLSGSLAGEYAVSAMLASLLGKFSSGDSITVALRGYNASLEQVLTRSIVFGVSQTPASFALAQNYPNPFNPSTTIEYDLATDCRVDLALYDVLGKRVATLVNAEQSAGSYRYQLNSGSIKSGLATGIYFYRLQAGSFTATRKLVLMK